MRMHSRAGFTFVECIMAALVVLVAFLALARMNPSGYRSAALDRNRLSALRVARNVLETARSMPFTTDYSSLKQNNIGFGPEQVEGNTVNQTFDVTDVQVLPIVPPPANPSFQQLQVTVQWREGTMTGSAGTTGSNKYTKKLVVTGGLSIEP